MDEPAHIVRLQLLHVIGAVGTIRDHTTQFDAADSQYVERELAKMQAAAHRLLEFLDHADRPN